LQHPDLFFLLRTYERKKENYGLREVKIFKGNIGYLDLRLFEPIDLVRDKFRHVLHFLEDTDALIIDLRKNSGGNPAAVQFLCSWFFDEPVHLNTIYWRRGDYEEEFWSKDSIGISKKPELPLFILISSKTFSAAEEFAYTLQTLKRATLIGELTAGAANPGYQFSLNDQFSIFIPTGQSINPVSGTNWEGVGVKPDIAVSSVNALETALEKALLAGRIYRQKQDDQRIGQFMKLANKIKETQTSIKTGQRTQAENDLEEILNTQVKQGIINEWTLNTLAYRFMSDEKLQLGNRQAGIEAYQKALSLDPDSQNARIMLDKLNRKNTSGPEEAEK
jgi:C-terminal processing protease CtpA/Prc